MAVQLELRTAALLDFLAVVLMVVEKAQKLVAVEVEMTDYQSVVVMVPWLVALMAAKWEFGTVALLDILAFVLMVA